MSAIVFVQKVLSQANSFDIAAHEAVPVVGLSEHVKNDILALHLVD